MDTSASYSRATLRRRLWRRRGVQRGAEAWRNLQTASRWRCSPGTCARRSLPTTGRCGWACTTGAPRDCTSSRMANACRSSPGTARPALSPARDPAPPRTRSARTSPTAGRSKIAWRRPRTTAPGGTTTASGVSTTSASSPSSGAGPRLSTRSHHPFFDWAVHPARPCFLSLLDRGWKCVPPGWAIPGLPAGPRPFLARILPGS